jgi:hypothetical protein
MNSGDHHDDAAQTVQTVVNRRPITVKPRMKKLLELPKLRQGAPFVSERSASPMLF